MRILSITLALLVALSSNLFAKDKVYGEGISLTNITKVSEILAKPEEFEGKKVLIEGMITGVCEARGCWMSIASDKNFQEIKIKVLDGVIVFPMSAYGKVAKVEGVVEDSANLDAYEKKHYKGNEAKHKKYKQNEPSYRIRVSGAIISE